MLFTSGYTDNAIVHHGRLDAGVQLISKPYAATTWRGGSAPCSRRGSRWCWWSRTTPWCGMAAVDMIEALGFTPLQAADAEAALTILQGAGRIDVLFTDIGLPGMRGPELAQAARAAAARAEGGLRQRLRRRERGSALEGAVQLGKPYEQDQLAEVLGAAVG